MTVHASLAGPAPGWAEMPGKPGPRCWKWPCYADATGDSLHTPTGTVLGAGPQQGPGPAQLLPSELQSSAAGRGRPGTSLGHTELTAGERNAGGPRSIQGDPNSGKGPSEALPQAETYDLRRVW